MHAIGFLPCEQNLCRRTGVHREHGADRDGVAEAGHPLCCGNAHSLIALPSVQLCALAGCVAQCVQDRCGRNEQLVFACCRREFGDAAAEHESAVEVTRDKSVMFERAGESMGGGPRQSGGLHESREGLGAGFECVEHDGGLVEDADATSNVHMLIFASQHTKWQDEWAAGGAPYSHHVQLWRRSYGSHTCREGLERPRRRPE